MGFFSNIGSDQVTKEYKKAVKKLNAAMKRHPENFVDVGDDKLIFVCTRKRDPMAFPFEGITTYNTVCKGIMDFLANCDPKNEYSYYKLDYVHPFDIVFKRCTINYDENKIYPLNTLVLEFKSNSNRRKYYAIDNIFDLRDQDSIRKAVVLYYINNKKIIL